ncbi:helix-turn-helix domain-containing protein [Kitasatospora sp. NPDC007106]|uniref:PucR family transcriptional regulator n=1 Tax=Kitasatospora sp. NPDC007106 TaxID=3156914 RepID=UPI0033E34B94
MDDAQSPMEGTSEELFALANAIAAVTGGSVAVEDLDRRVLAYSALPDQRIDELRRRGILERRVPDQAEQPAQYREVLAAPGVMRLPTLAEDELPRAAVAIRAGDLPLGTIWAIEGPDGLDPAGERAMRDGARLAALHILRRRSAQELELRAREDGLRDALHGGGRTADLRYALGLPERPRLVLVGLTPLRLPADEPPSVVRLAAAAARHWAAVHGEAAVAAVGRTVYVLLAEVGPAAARRLAEQAVAALGPSGGGLVRAAVSRPAEDLEAVPALRAEVDDVLRVISADPGCAAVASLTDVHARVLLAKVADELARRPELRHPAVEAMLAHDREHRTEYARSVAAWLDAVGSVATAAERVGVHPNTLKYRLRRAGQLFGLDLEHPDDRLSAWLQLRLAL